MSETLGIILLGIALCSVGGAIGYASARFERSNAQLALFLSPVAAWVALVLIFAIYEGSIFVGLAGGVILIPGFCMYFAVPVLVTTFLGQACRKRCPVIPAQRDRSLKDMRRNSRRDVCVAINERKVTEVTPPA